MTRHTVMVVGQTGGGKSVILQTLARCQTKMGKRTTMNVLNPKVQPKHDILRACCKRLTVSSYSILWHQLRKSCAMSICDLWCLNLQALSVAELYGVLDTDTRDWTDGLLSNIFRDINKPLPPGKVC